LLNDLKIVIGLLKKILDARSPVSGEASNEWLVKQCLLHNVTYQLTAEASHDKWIGFRELKRTTKNIFARKSATQQLEQASSSVVLGGFMASQEVIVNYIEFETGKKIGWYLAKTEWPEVSAPGKFVFWWKWFWFSMPFAFRCITEPNRTNIALLIRETADTALLLFWLRKKKIKHVYNFLPYELDSNLISLLCRQHEIQVTKIPSSGPLSTHNRIMISDEVAFSSSYHNEEYALYRESIRTSKVLMWGPERAYTYIHRYSASPLATPQKTIGFYSHGAWIRQADDHASDGLNIGDAELNLLNHLAVFMKNNPGYSLIVFPHPRERNEKRWNDTQDFYSKHLHSTRFSFAAKGIATAHSFEIVDIAVAAFSTIVFERLFCGFKTLIGNYGIPGFPIEDSTLQNICFNSLETMSSKILSACTQSTDEFFSTNKISGYRFHAYPKYTQPIH